MMHHQMAEGSKHSWCRKPAFGEWTGLRSLFIADNGGTNLPLGYGQDYGVYLLQTIVELSMISRY